MNFTYYGHSCFSVTVGGKKLLFDPFISGNELAKDIDINTIEADYILLSHGHFDHVADVETIAKSTGATLIANYEVATWFGGKGVGQYHPMNTGGKHNFDFGTVKCISAVHSSSMPDGSNGGNPMGFIIFNTEKNFYYSGDTALTLDMQLVAGQGEIGFAVLPIGDNFTMGIEDAAKAAKMVQTKTVIPVHYDTFGYIITDHKKAKDYFGKEGLDLRFVAIGETVTI
jgi:L-ascorbate metabolism protein UlaG (beta-lactamase superfamily)